MTRNWWKFSLKYLGFLAINFCFRLTMPQSRTTSVPNLRITCPSCRWRSRCWGRGRGLDSSEQGRTLSATLLIKKLNYVRIFSVRRPLLRTYCTYTLNIRVSLSYPGIHAYFIDPRFRFRKRRRLNYAWQPVHKLHCTRMKKRPTAVFSQGNLLSTFVRFKVIPLTSDDQVFILTKFPRIDFDRYGFSDGKNRIVP